MKTNNSRLLFIEDYEDDYLLLLRQLKKAGHQVVADRIYTKADYKKAIKENWDAIICDNNLPEFNAHEALKLIRAINKDIPFIIVSGAITDKEAAEAMNAGANDYIIKGDYNRFIPALFREIREYKMKQEKKKVEKELIKKEEAFHLLTENAQDLLLLADKQGKILYISASVQKIVGYIPEDVLGKNICDFLLPEDTIKFESILKKIHDGAIRPFKAIYEVYKADGSIAVLENIIKPYKDEDGNIKLISTSRDITEINRYREEIAETNKKFTIAAQELQHLINHANAPIFGINWNGEINEWNPVSQKLTGYSKEEVLGKKIFEQVIPKNYHTSIIRIFKNALLDEKSVNYEVPIITINGENKILLLSATPRRDYDGEVIGVICYGQDITDIIGYRERLEKKVEDRTRQLNESLQKEKELSTLKTRFVSMASHEFKTPLSTISFAAEYLERYMEKAPKEKIQERITKIKDQVSNMIYLLNDVLTIGKSEEGKIKINKASIHILDFIKKLKEDIENTANLKHKVELNLDFPVNLKINSDKVLLTNVCSNLLNNATKYSPGQDKVIWSIKTESGELVFTFTDFGIGIPPEDQNKIFEPFHRSSNTIGFEGTGLGLSIVKRAAESLGGNVRLVISSSERTTFEFSMPIS